MAIMIEIVSLDAESDLAKKLKNDSGKEFVLVTAGRHFRVVEDKSAELLKVYDPEKVREALDLCGGSWANSGIDAEAAQKSAIGIL